jgi:sorbitol/mannitol transport system permease protein
MAAPARLHQPHLPRLPQALLQFDVGGASAGGIVAVVLANIVAIFLMRLVGKNLEA